MNNLIKQKQIEILNIELKIKKLELDILKELHYEFFLPIKNYENYSISNFGIIKNNKTNRIMKQDIRKDGYKQIKLYKNGIMKSFRVHRLVAKAFLENPDNKPKVDHIDENKSNNNVKNLRWSTVQDNSYNRGKQINNTSGFKGVSFHKNANKYRATIKINGKYKHLGLFLTPEEASEKYEITAKELHGNFYYKNK
jgi:hypothetical protein